MTRINCIPVEELSSPHLMAEYREITRVAKQAKVLDDYGQYCMGPGHVRFFYNKLDYLEFRMLDLYRECVRRGFKVQEKDFWQGVGLNHRELSELANDWEPTIEDQMINASRLNDKLDGYPNYNYRR